jgi:CubicO group peptidase (beta-lactamase class C family)
MSTFDFARRYLAEPLAIAIRPWIRDPQGIYLGGNDMHLTPRAMLEYGELYLNRGRMKEKQIVSARWVEESLKPRTKSSWSGRLLWIRLVDRHFGRADDPLCLGTWRPIYFHSAWSQASGSYHRGADA